jgi:hypothetical protein
MERRTEYHCPEGGSAYPGPEPADLQDGSQAYERLEAQ